MPHGILPHIQWLTTIKTMKLADVNDFAIRSSLSDIPCEASRHRIGTTTPREDELLQRIVWVNGAAA